MVDKLYEIIASYILQHKAHILKLGSDIAIDEWKEHLHPRDKRGRFTKKFSSDIIRNKTQGRIWLTRQEYAQVMGAINTVYAAKYKGREGKICTLLHFKTEYKFINHGFNEYEFISAEPIIETIIEEIDKC